jgi:hypothetical protein
VYWWRDHASVITKKQVLKIAPVRTSVMSGPAPQGDTMSMTMNEIERALRELRLSGIRATLDTRVLQAQATQEPFLDTFSLILQDELDLSSNFALLPALIETEVEK